MNDGNPVVRARYDIYNVYNKQSPYFHFYIDDKAFVKFMVYDNTGNMITSYSAPVQTPEVQEEKTEETKDNTQV